MFDIILIKKKKENEIKWRAKKKTYVLGKSYIWEVCGLFFYSHRFASERFEWFHDEYLLIPNSIQSFCCLSIQCIDTYNLYFHYNNRLYLWQQLFLSCHLLIGSNLVVWFLQENNTRFETDKEGGGEITKWLNDQQHWAEDKNERKRDSLLGACKWLWAVLIMHHYWLGVSLIGRQHLALQSRTK